VLPRLPAAPPDPRPELDWKRECAETAVVLKVRRDDGPDLMTFTEAGALWPLWLQCGRHCDHRKLSPK